MPIYEYACQACGQDMEKLQKLSDPELTDCPACGKPDLVKKVSAAAFRLKGGGWYETDFKSGDKKNLASGSSDTKSSSDSKGESTSKAAPAKPKPSSSEAA